MQTVIFIFVNQNKCCGYSKDLYILTVLDTGMQNGEFRFCQSKHVVNTHKNCLKGS